MPPGDPALKRAGLPGGERCQTKKKSEAFRTDPSLNFWFRNLTEAISTMALAPDPSTSQYSFLVLAL